MDILRQLQAIQANQNISQEETQTSDNGKFEMVDLNNLPKGYVKVNKRITKVNIQNKPVIELNDSNAFTVTFNRQKYDKLIIASDVHKMIKRLITLYRKNKPDNLDFNYSIARELLNANSGKLVIETVKLHNGQVKSQEMVRGDKQWQENYFGKKENADLCNRRIKPDNYADIFTCELVDVIGIYFNNRSVFTKVKQKSVTIKHDKLVSNQTRLTFSKLDYETSYYVPISDDHKWSKYRCKDGFLTFKLKVISNGNVIAKLSNTCLEQTIGEFTECKDIKVRINETIFDNGMAFIPRKSIFSDLLDNKLNGRLSNISDDIALLLNSGKTRKGKDIKIIRNNLRRILENDTDTNKLEKCLTITTRYPNTFLIGYLLDQNDQSLLIVKRMTLEMRHGEHNDTVNHLVRLTNNVKLTM